MKKAIADNMVPDHDKLPGNNCYGNERAIFLDIHESSEGFEIRICTFLDYDIAGELSADGLFDLLDESISLELDSDYALKGTISTGVKITITSLLELPVIELDPIIVGFSLQSEFSGAAAFGLLASTVSGDVTLQGRFGMVLCSSCDGTYPHDDGYEQIGENSAFYFSSFLSYDFNGELELSAGVTGVDLIGARISVIDTDVFDNTNPLIEIQNAQSLMDAMVFSPENAVSKSMVIILCIPFNMHITAPLFLCSFSYAATD